jgi:tRNA-splicing ligase RtcB
METNYEAHEAPGGGVVKAWTRGVLFEEEARRQVDRIASMPFIHRHVAIMPDVHAGKGATVGSVIPTVGAIIPAAVGVDIGCGMMAIETMATLDDLDGKTQALHDAIARAVPHGRTDNGGANDRGAWGTPPERVADVWRVLQPAYERIVGDDPGALLRKGAVLQLGTLGTGNHFIEVCGDESGHVWVVLHSGSRGVGNRIGSYFIEKAKEEMERFFIHLPDKDLAYLPEGSKHFDRYVRALFWAQRYAAMNRDLMMAATLDAAREIVPTMKTDGFLSKVVRCHHNYVEREHHFGREVWLTRKGAVAAGTNDWGVIPGSMGTRSYIVRGKGNRDAFNSCSHGAGRAMSRTEARRRFTVEDHALATQGVACRKDADVIDETPAAYKDIDAVMEAQKDLVEIVHTLKQVVCVKG